MRAQRAEIGPCPNGDGVIRENRFAYGCSSWKSKEEPGCGFVIWKQQKGRSISPGRGARPARARPDRAAGRVQDAAQPRPPGAGRRQGAAGRRGRHPAGRTRRARARRSPTCPKCARGPRRADPREQPRLRLLLLEEPQGRPGCGFVIWKSTKGRQITAEEARQVIESGASDWMEFRDRKGPFRGRLVLTEDRTVDIEREGEGARASRPSRPPPGRPDPEGCRCGRSSPAGRASSARTSPTGCSRAATRCRGRQPLDRAARAGAGGGRFRRAGHPRRRGAAGAGRRGAAGRGLPPGRPGRRAGVGGRPRPGRRRERARHRRAAGGGAPGRARGWCSRPPAARIYGEADTIPSPEDDARGADGAVRHREAVRRALPRPATTGCTAPATWRSATATCTARARTRTARRAWSRSSSDGSPHGERPLVFGDGRQTRDYVLRRRRGGRQPGGARLLRSGVGVQHRHPAARRTWSICWRPASGWPAPTSRRSSGRRGWARSTAAASTAGGPHGSWAGGRQVSLEEGCARRSQRSREPRLAARRAGRSRCSR